MEIIVFGSPKCRFCGKEWQPPPGVHANDSYCRACSDARQAIAREELQLQPIEAEELVGIDYLIDTR